MSKFNNSDNYGFSGAIIVRKPSKSTTDSKETKSKEKKSKKSK